MRLDAEVGEAFGDEHAAAASRARDFGLTADDEAVLHEPFAQENASVGDSCCGVVPAALSRDRDVIYPHREAERPGGFPCHLAKALR